VEASILFWFLGAMLMSIGWVRYRNPGVGLFVKAPWKLAINLKTPGRILLIVGEVFVAVGYASAFIF